MKKALFMMAIVANIYASGQSNQIEFNALALPWGNIDGAYFYNINENHSVGITLGFKYPSQPWTTISQVFNGRNLKWSGFHFMPEYRYFFNPPHRSNNSGWVAGVFGRYMNYTSEGGKNYEHEKSTLFGIGLKGGYTFSLGDHFLMYPSLSCVYYFINNSNSRDFDEFVVGNHYSNDYDNLKLDFLWGLNIIWRFD